MSMTTKQPMQILEEALEVVRDRQGSYGHPRDHWAKTIGMINLHFGTDFDPKDWGTMMIFDKLARESNKSKRDNMVDVAGYANARQMVIDAEDEDLPL